MFCTLSPTAEPGSRVDEADKTRNPMNHCHTRTILQSLAWTFFACACGWLSTAVMAAEPLPPSAGEQAAEATRPNIVFCMADDWSWPHASALGDPVVQTPNFDRIAVEGILFHNAFVSASSCTPSRLSILTGQHHWRLREGDSLGGRRRLEIDVKLLDKIPLFSKVKNNTARHRLR